MANITLDAMELSKNSVVMTVEMRRMREWNLRIKVMSLLLRLACWISPFEVQIIGFKHEPWLFYCPYCKHDTKGEIVCDGLFTQQCNVCNRFFLAMASSNIEGRARAVHNPSCDSGCQYAEPFGWVISADCELHKDLPG